MTVQPSQQPIYLLLSHPHEPVLLTEEFVNQGNSTLWPQDKLVHVKGFLDQAREMGGLTSDVNAQRNISKARHMLVILCGMNERRWAQEAIENLLELLINECLAPMQPNHADGVLRVMVKLLDYLHKDTIQFQTTQMQIKLSLCCCWAGELVLRHFAAGYINGITVEIKNRARAVADQLGSLNRQNHVGLKTNLDRLTEILKRLKSDDRQLNTLLTELTTTADTLLQVAAAGGALANYNPLPAAQALFGAMNTLSHAGLTLYDIFSIKVLSKWFDQLYVIRNMAQQAITDLSYLQMLRDILYCQGLGDKTHLNAVNKTKASKITVSQSWQLTIALMEQLAIIARKTTRPDICNTVIETLSELEACHVFGVKKGWEEAVTHLGKAPEIHIDQFIQNLAKELKASLPNRAPIAASHSSSSAVHHHPSNIQLLSSCLKVSPDLIVRDSRLSQITSSQLTSATTIQALGVFIAHNKEIVSTLDLTVLGPEVTPHIAILSDVLKGGLHQLILPGSLTQEQGSFLADVLQCNTSLTIQLNHPEAYWQLSWALCVRGEHDLRLRELAGDYAIQGIQSESNGGEEASSIALSNLWRVRAEVLRDQEHFSSSYAEAAKAIQLNEKNLGALRLQILNCIRLKYFIEAVEHGKTLIQLAPQSPNNQDHFVTAIRVAIKANLLVTIEDIEKAHSYLEVLKREFPQFRAKYIEDDALFRQRRNKQK